MKSKIEKGKVKLKMKCEKEKGKVKLKMKSEKEKEKMQLKMKSEKEKGKMKLKMRSGAGKGEREINIFRKSLTCSGNQEPANVVITIVISLTTFKYCSRSFNLSRLLSIMKRGQTDTVLSLSKCGRFS